MNTNQVKKLTLVSYSCQGRAFSQFVMANYDEKGHAHIDREFIPTELEKHGLRKNLQNITVG